MIQYMLNKSRGSISSKQNTCRVLHNIARAVKKVNDVIDANHVSDANYVSDDDVIDVNIWFMRNQNASGIFNVGTGKSQTFDEVADAVIKWNKKGKISYIPFPENLKGSYQSYTQADISKLRECGYEKPFRDVQSGVKSYLDNFSTWPKNE